MCIFSYTTQLRYCTVFDMLLLDHGVMVLRVYS